MLSEIRTLRQAAKIARDGATIEVDTGDYEGDTAVWTQNNLIIRGTRTRADDFAEPSKFDYRLRKSSKLLGTAGVAGTFNNEIRPTSEYRHVAGSVDLGLTELTPLSPGAFQRLAQ